MKGASLLDTPSRGILRAPDAGGAEAIGSLPEWDLADLYDGIDSKALAGDIERAKPAAGDRGAATGFLTLLKNEEIT